MTAIAVSGRVRAGGSYTIVSQCPNTVLTVLTINGTEYTNVTATRMGAQVWIKRKLDQLLHDDNRDD